MKTIKILGTGCPKCKTTYSNVMQAVEQSGVEAEIIKVEDIEKIMEYNIMSTPALVLNETVKIKGRVAKTDEVIELLKA